MKRRAYLIYRDLPICTVEDSALTMFQHPRVGTVLLEESPAFFSGIPIISRLKEYPFRCSEDRKLTERITTQHFVECRGCHINNVSKFFGRQRHTAPHS